MKARSAYWAAFPGANTIFVLLVLFLIVFPKGGIKIAGMPITHGYVMLVVFGIAAGLSLLGRAMLRSRSATVWLMGAPFMAIVGLTGAYQGFSGLNIMFAVSMCCVVVPTLFLLLYANHIGQIDPALFRRAIVYSIRAVAIYGVALFFFRKQAGYFFEIPLLTSNLGDMGLLDTKNIKRGDVYKLISTFNNGNIYGVCILILFPLYYYFERSKIFIAIVLLSLVLTISRTVWAGVVVSFVMIALINRVNTRVLLSFLVFAALGAFSIQQTLALIGQGAAFLFDSNLGGRAGTLAQLGEFRLLPQGPVRGIAEITYAGMFIAFGFVGLVAFLFHIASPLWVFWRTEKQKSPMQLHALAGVMTYLAISWSDGAMVFIPTIALYWFVCIVMLEGKHLDQPAVPRLRRPAAYPLAPRYA